MDFTEEIKRRKAADDEGIREAFRELADTVLAKGSKKDDKNNNNFITEAEKIVTFFGFKTGPVPEGLGGFDEMLDYLCRCHSIMYRMCRIQKGWYKNATGAFLAIMKDDRVVALLPKKGGYYFEDPETHLAVRVNKKRSELFTEKAIYFYKPFPQKKIAFTDLLKFSFSFVSGLDVAALVVLTGVITAVSYFIPKVTYFLYNQVALPSAFGIGLLISTSVFFFCLLLGNILFGLLKNLFGEKILTKISTGVQSATMMRVFSLSPSFFKKFSSAELYSRIENVEVICSSIAKIIFSALLTALFSLVYITQLAEYDYRLVLCAVISIVASLVLTTAVTFIQQKYTINNLELSSKENGMSYSMINGMQKIRLAGSEKRAFTRWAKLYTKKINILCNPPFIVKYSSSFGLAISLVTTIVIFYLAGTLTYAISGFDDISMTAADLIAFLSAFGLMRTAFTSITDLALSIADVRPNVLLAKPILDAEPEISENRHAVMSLSGKIDISGISFRYDDKSPYIIKNLNLSINPGEYVAVIGRSGCGKSTLIRLLLGFEKPELGAIYYDGNDISSVDISSVRRKIGVVMQNGSLFQGSISDNIRLNAQSLSNDELWEAARKADVADFINELPMGMNTIVSGGEGGFSGGQIQRILIARAIAPKPSILVFDEATSALDNISQEKISKSLDNLECTRIIVAHRLSTIKNCSRILVLDDGEIVEDGTYEDLISNNGLFSELVERQRLDMQ